MSETTENELQGGLTEEQKRENVIALAFGGRRDLYDAFVKAIEEVVPADTTVVLRGSAVTGRRWTDNAPLDAAGPGTSHLDLTLGGSTVIPFFNLTGFFV